MSDAVHPRLQPHQPQVRPFWQRHGLEPVAPVADDGRERPLLSVAVPLYVKSAQDFALAERCLRSVLVEAIGNPAIELLVVDDGSPTPGVAEFVHAVSGGRARYERNPRNLWLIENWRRCVNLSRGQWVHLLHDDDLVYRDFYPVVLAAIANHPDIGQIATQVVTSPGPTQVQQALTMKFQAAGPTVFPDWLAQVSEFSKLWHTGVVTRRSVFEEVGNWGFEPEFPPHYLAPDWEFFVRTACAGTKTLFIPRVLAHYCQTQTSTAVEHNQTWDNLTALTLIKRLQRYLGDEAARPLVQACAKFYLGLNFRHLVGQAEQFAYESVRIGLRDDSLAKLLEIHPEGRTTFDQLAELVAKQTAAWEAAPEFFRLS